MRQLLEAGACPNEKGGFYGNALRAAAHEGHAEVANILLEAGAKDDFHDIYSCSTLKLARHHRKGSVISTILEHVITDENFSTFIGTLDVLLELLNGDWRGYYYYAAGNRARDEGEVIFTLRTIDPVEDDDDDGQRVRIEGSGEDKWGKFVIVGEATVQGEISFQKDYEVWGWNYSGQLSAAERAMAGRWGRDGQDIHGTFAFYRA